MSDIEKIQENLSQVNSTLDQLNDRVSHAEGQEPPPYVALCAAPSTSNYWQNVAEPILRSGGGQNKSDIVQDLGPLAALIGTWVSTPQNGFNVMPIPEATAKNGFILKNFYYYEEITFSAISEKVANRGGTDEQDCYTIFYEQRVFFSDGPQKDQLVHAENGTWLHLVKTQQKLGAVGFDPMPSPPAPNPVPPQDPETAIVKQVSVPHGNSILANGSFTIFNGAPSIPDVNTLPIGAPKGFDELYGPNVANNPNINPNAVLQATLALTPADSVVRTTFIDVDSDNNGDVLNIPYMRSHINVSRFTNQLWLEELTSGIVQMQYSQNITLDFPQPDGSVIQFPHIVANTLRRTS